MDRDDRVNSIDRVQTHDGGAERVGIPIANVAQLPVTPRCGEVSIRVGTLRDLAWIDPLQKKHREQVGMLYTSALRAYLERGDVLVAEIEDERVRGSGGEGVNESDSTSPSHPLTPSPAHPLGYIIFRDRYMKREDVGIIYQLNVVPGSHRKLIGASLVKAAFERAAYGCRLFCCWCAQDIEANYFWESIGFVPLAFRTGGRTTRRTHIFWQRRVRAGDEGPGATPLWFPSQTGGGAVKEDRLVFPIPPGTHWRDAKPLIFPEEEREQTSQTDENLARLELTDDLSPEGAEWGTLPGGAPVRPRDAARAALREAGEGQQNGSAAAQAARQRAEHRNLGGVPAGKKAVITANGMRFVARKDGAGESANSRETSEGDAQANGEMILHGSDDAASAKNESAETKKKEKQSRPRLKNAPAYVAAARELRDRYLEAMNDPMNDAVLQPESCGKWDVSRAMDVGDAASSALGDSQMGVSGVRRIAAPPDQQQRLLDAA